MNHKMYVEVREGVRCTNRELNEQEVGKVTSIRTNIENQQKIIKEAQTRLNDLLKKCEEDEFLSKVFYDVAGHPYDVRHFFLTKKTSLI